MTLMHWDKVIPWMHKNELWVFLIPFMFLMLGGLASC